MMTKWDTIQEDVKDAYIGVEENLAWEEAYKEEFFDYLDDNDEDEIFDMFGDK